MMSKAEKAVVGSSQPLKQMTIPVVRFGSSAQPRRRMRRSQEIMRMLNIARVPNSPKYFNNPTYQLEQYGGNPFKGANRVF